jgi:hypothetical protein
LELLRQFALAGSGWNLEFEFLEFVSRRNDAEQKEMGLYHAAMNLYHAEIIGSI